MKRQKTDPKLSIIIVSYNTRELLRACFSSIAKSHSGKSAWEVIVVDNGSQDGSVEEIKNGDTILIQNTVNKGFAAANNQGIRIAKSDYILLLNTDCEVEPDTIVKTLDYFHQHPEIGAVTCKLLLPDGSLDTACHRGFPTPWAAFTYFTGLEKLFGRSRIFGQYHQQYKPMDDPHDVDSISGAFFLIRRSVVDAVGLLDENFFMYGEDIDWCYRIRNRGMRIAYYPYASVIHKKHQSGLDQSNDGLRLQTKRHFYDAMRIFYNKHYRRRYGWIATALVLLGIKVLQGVALQGKATPYVIHEHRY